MHISDESRRRWPDYDACKQIADECRHFDAFGNEPED